MTIWLDNHLSPALARWIEAEFLEPCTQVRDLGLARAPDTQIFDAARAVARVIVTKDRDFAEIVRRRGPPPAIILLAIGNTSTAHVRSVLGAQMHQALAMITAGEPLVEIGGAA